MITIRRRDWTDLPACVAVLAEVHRSDGYPAMWPDDPAGWLDPAKLVDARVAVLGGDIVGQVGVGTGTVPAEVSGAAAKSSLVSVIRLFVAPPVRARGIGRLLLDSAVDMASQRGHRAVLDVEVGAAAAIALYERAGWTWVHTAPGGWTTSDGRQAVLRYYLGP